VFTARYGLIVYIKQVFITMVESFTALHGLIAYINQVFITAAESVYSAVRIDCLYKPNYVWTLTLSLLMSCIYMELLGKPQILTSYIYGHTFGNAESRFFLFAAQYFNTESM
jgi:hypothetical protein